MIFLRARRFNTTEWTTVTCDGDMEEAIAKLIAEPLEIRLEVHLQIAREGEAFVDLEDFEWEE